MERVEFARAEPLVRQSLAAVTAALRRAESSVRHGTERGAALEHIEEAKRLARLARHLLAEAV